MKKFAAIAVAASMFALAACGEKAAEEATPEAPAAEAKPAAAKGQYMKKIAVSSTMGLGVRVDTGSVN